MSTSSKNSSTLTRNTVAELYDGPLLNLIFLAAQTHRRHRDPSKVQCAALLSVKTGGCPEDCAYCPQSAHYDAGIDSSDLLSLDSVLRAWFGGGDENGNSEKALRSWYMGRRRLGNHPT